MTRRAIRATAVQAALVGILVGLMMILFGGGGAVRRPEPQPARSVRPATTDERRQWEVDRLSECLRDLDWCHESGVGVASP